MNGQGLKVVHKGSRAFGSSRRLQYWIP